MPTTSSPAFGQKSVDTQSMPKRQKKTDTQSLTKRQKKTGTHLWVPASMLAVITS